MTTGPSSSTSLHASNNLIPWSGARYTVALGSLLAIGGRLAERLGRREMHCSRDVLNRDPLVDVCNTVGNQDLSLKSMLCCAASETQETRPKCNAACTRDTMAGRRVPVAASAKLPTPTATGSQFADTVGSAAMFLAARR